MYDPLYLLSVSDNEENDKNRNSDASEDGDDDDAFFKMRKVSEQ